MGNSLKQKVIIDHKKLKFISKNQIAIDDLVIFVNGRWNLFEANAQLIYSQKGELINYASLIFINQFSLQNNDQYQALLVQTIFENQQIVVDKKYIAYQFALCQKIEDAEKLIQGYIGKKQIKGNVPYELSTEIIIEKIQKNMQININNETIQSYFQIDQANLKQIQEVNNNYNNFMDKLIASYLLQNSFYALHKIENALQMNDTRQKQIAKFLQEFQYCPKPGQKISNKMNWITKKQAKKENINYLLQEHKWSEDGSFGKAISDFFRTISPLSPHTKKYRIVCFSENNQEHDYTELDSSDQYNLLEQEFDNLTKEETIDISQLQSMFISKRFSKNDQPSQQ